MHGSVSESEAAQLCLTLCDPMDCSLPGSSIHGILRARVLERAAISFSREIIIVIVAQLLSHLRLFVTPWTIAH